MQRRKFLIGMGSLAAGSAAAMGTGAFSSAEADRTMSVDVVGDASAYLALSEGPNTDVADDVVTKNSGELELNFDGTNTNGSGLNQDAVTEFTNVLTAANNGTTEVLFGVDTSNIRSNSGISDFNIYAHADGGSPEYDGEYVNANGNYPAYIEDHEGDPIVDLTTGESVNLSIQINTNDEAFSTDLTIPFVAVEKGGRYDGNPF